MISSSPNTCLERKTRNLNNLHDFGFECIQVSISAVFTFCSNSVSEECRVELTTDGRIFHMLGKFIEIFELGSLPVS